MPATITTNGTLTVEATDNTGVVRVAFVLNTTVLDDRDGSDGFNIPFSLATAKAGANTLFFVIYDAAGNFVNRTVPFTVVK